LTGPCSWQGLVLTRAMHYPGIMPNSKYKQLGDLLTVGIMFPACIGIGYGIGYWVDRWVGTQSAFKIVFLLFGIAAGFINLFRIVNKVSNGDQSP